MVRDPGVGTFHAETQYHGRSMSQKRTFHANAPYRGWFGVQGWTFHVSAPYRGQFGYQGLNLPRLGPESWTVRVS